VDVYIPAYLHQHLLHYGFGADGTGWLADLPRRIAELEQEWDLRVGSAFDKDGAVSWVAPVELRDGSEAILKVTFPHGMMRRASRQRHLWPKRRCRSCVSSSGRG